ncbi:MAG: Holliday junction branch migration protein RuvA [Bacillota bacterium]|jgi:Holliday junction DNA helicase RuvA|nr:Holliday junction branch migration protein RuvA [Thermoanaerobacteraceae bacterium]
MITYLRGKLVRAAAGSAVIEVGGVGYHVHIPLSLGARLPRPGAECRLYTHFLLREEQVALYGFGTEEERDLFVLLLGVSGVGPKAALAILSCLSVQEIERALLEEEASVLRMVPGIGEKTAQRILLELKDKFAKREESVPEETADAVEALVSLGYRRGEAREAVRHAVKGGAGDLETILRSALGLLLKRKGGSA